MPAPTDIFDTIAPESGASATDIFDTLPAGNRATEPRQQAIQILTGAAKPVTEANIQAVIKKLGR